MIKVANNLNYFIRTKRALGETLTEPAATSPVETPRARSIYRFSPRPPEHPFEYPPLLELSTFNRKLPSKPRRNVPTPTRSWRELARAAYGGDTNLLDRMLAGVPVAQKSLKDDFEIPSAQLSWMPKYENLNVSHPIHSSRIAQMPNAAIVPSHPKQIPNWVAGNTYMSLRGDQGGLNVFGLTPKEQSALRSPPLNFRNVSLAANFADIPYRTTLKDRLDGTNLDSLGIGLHEATHLMPVDPSSARSKMDPYLTGVPGVKRPAKRRTTESHGMTVQEFPAHLSEMKNMFWRDTGIEPIFDSPEKVQQFNEYMNELQKTYPGSKDRHGEIMQYFQDMNNPDMQAQYLNSVVQNDNKGRNQAPYAHYQTI